MSELTKTRAFLAALHAGGAVSYIWKPGKKMHDGQTRKRPENYPCTKWYRVTTPYTLPHIDTGGDRYFGVNPSARIPPTNSNGKDVPSRMKRGQIAHLAAQTCVYAEFDAKDHPGGKTAIMAHIETLPLQPSVIIDSGGGFHCYWLLLSPWGFGPNKEKAQQIAKDRQAAWVKFVGGDYGAHCLARVLRLPGTLNTKYTPARRVSFVKCDLGRRYGYQAIDMKILDLLTEVRNARKPHKTTATGPALDGQRLAKASIVGILRKIQTATDGNRNSLLHWGACRLGGFVASDWAGLDYDRAADLLLQVSPLPDGESDATIKSGLSEGSKKPAQRQQTETMQDRVRRYLS